MRRWLAWLAPGLSLAMIAGCTGLDDPDAELEALLARREARLDRALALPDSIVSDAPVLRWILPEELAEVSGMLVTDDDRLFVHGDEVATIYEVDYRRGLVVKRFSLGSPVIRGDFEAITMARDTMLMLTSDGMVYRFVEGADSATVPYTRFDTGLGSRCEFEGMAFDSVADALILACKNVRDDELESAVVLFRWPLGTDTSMIAQPLPPLTIPLAAVIGTRAWNQFQPSDLTINPHTGNYLIVAARQQALVEVSPAGEVVLGQTLPPGHPQAEGVAITSENLLMVSDEANLTPAAITAYRWQP